MRLTLLLTLLITSFLFSGTSLKAQEAVTPRPSPTAIVTVKYEDTYVKVTYSQPHKRGRKVFGGLVPYGQVWRSGANEATEITLTESIMFNGKELEAGTYAIFTIPEEDEWTIILNDDLGQWGAYSYTESSDVRRFKVPVTHLEEEVWEPFTITFNQNNNEASMLMMWDDVQVSIPIRFIEH